MQLPPIGFQQAQYPAPPSGGVPQQPMPDYNTSHIYSNYQPHSPYGQPNQNIYNQCTLTCLLSSEDDVTDWLQPTVGHPPATSGCGEVWRARRAHMEMDGNSLSSSVGSSLCSISGTLRLMLEQTKTTSCRFVFSRLLLNPVPSFFKFFFTL